MKAFLWLRNCLLRKLALSHFSECQDFCPGVFLLVRDLRLFLPLSLNRGRGDGFSEYREGKSMLPLVRVRIVFCYVFSPLGPLFPWNHALRLHPGVILGMGFRVLSQGCDGACSSSYRILLSLNFIFLLSGGWRPIVDLSTLNLSVVRTCFF